MTSTAVAVPDADDFDRRMTARYSRVMRTQPRESWLVPLLAVPLCRIALSPALVDEDLVLSAEYPISRERFQYLSEGLDGIVNSVLATGRELTDDDAVILTGLAEGWLPLAGRFLAAPGQLLAGAGLPPDLTGDPLCRGVARWIAEGPEHVACAALVASHALTMAKHPLRWMPRACGRYAQVARAIDRRMQAHGITTWEQALVFAHRYWEGRGWLDLQMWQMRAGQRVHRPEAEERRPVPAARPAGRMRERETVARLGAAKSKLESELQALRPLQDKVERLRADAERLRVREAELVQARDRALARVEALETTRARLERELAAVRQRVDEPSASRAGGVEVAESTSEHRSEPPAILTEFYVEDTPLPATLLAGRVVFFFTGEERRSSAEATASSLHELGAGEIRTYCLRKGRSEGPDPFPPGSLVVVDIRWLGHSQSGLILDRAERNGVDHLVVRSGKGTLARVVAAGLRRVRGEQLKKSA